MSKTDLKDLFSGLKEFAKMLSEVRGEPHYRDLVEVHFSDELSTCEVMTQDEPDGHVVSQSFSTAYLDDPESALEKEKARRAALEEEQRQRYERHQVENREARRRKFVELAQEFEDDRDLAAIRAQRDALQAQLDAWLQAADKVKKLLGK